MLCALARRSVGLMKGHDVATAYVLVRGLLHGGILRFTSADDTTIDWHSFLKSCTNYARGLHAARSGYN